MLGWSSQGGHHGKEAQIRLQGRRLQEGSPRQEAAEVEVAHRPLLRVVRMATKKQQCCDLSLVPGTPAEQRDRARAMMARGEKPIAIEKVGRRYRIDVVGTPIGFVTNKSLACTAAHQVGRYRLHLGDMAFGYVRGWKGCDRL